eukprot:4067133-Prymnesium_polylepis.1
MISDSIAGLQLAFDCCWAVAKVCGLQVKIKGKSKTAFTAVYWEGGKEKDVDMGKGWGIRLPDGQWVPQIRADGSVVRRADWG